MMKKIVLIVSVLIAINLLLVGINILQKGTGGWTGQSMEEILGKPAADVTVEDIHSLSKAEVFQLFYAAPAPALKEMKGEYRAQTLPVGIMAFAADYFTHHFFGPGKWLGKAFYPFEEDRGWGYNVFEGKGEGAAVVHRTRKMNTWVGSSTIDDRVSFHLDYSPYNGGMVHSMHDEIRKIHDRLYLGMGYMAAGGGSINPAPFVLYGAPEKWKGIDK
jgi:hypothetical protein